MKNQKRFFIKLFAVFMVALLIGALSFAPHVATADRTTSTSIVLSNPNLRYQFENLAQRYPGSFQKYFGRPTVDAAENAVRLGRRVFVSEGCSHCHGQAVNLNGMAGAPQPSIAAPLNQVGGRFSNDWHAVHLFNPQWTVTGSPMPPYPWLFDGAPDQPNRRGLALITYLQWLGSWLNSYPSYENYRTIDQLQEAAEESGLGKARS